MMALPSSLDHLIPLLPAGPGIVAVAVALWMGGGVFLVSRPLFARLCGRVRWMARMLLGLYLLIGAVPMCFLPFATLVLFPWPIAIDDPDVMAVTIKHGLYERFIADELATRLPGADARFMNCARIVLLNPLTMDSNGALLDRRFGACDAKGRCEAVPRMDRAALIEKIEKGKGAYIPFIAKACEGVDVARLDPGFSAPRQPDLGTDNPAPQDAPPAEQTE